MESRPEFDKITSFDEFTKYYWYREELSQICKSLGLEYRGTKQELNYIIEQYFKGNLIKKSSIKNEKKQVENITLDTPLLCLLYTSPSPRDRSVSRMPSSA